MTTIDHRYVIDVMRKDPWYVYSSISIPEGVTEIYKLHGDLVDPGVDSRYFELPKTLRVFGERALALMSITAVTIPENVTKIEKEAFLCCRGLEWINFKTTKLESIGERAFEDCKKLDAIVIPSSVKEIEEGAFKGCSSLKRIELPDGLENANKELFYGCSSLTKVTIPSTVKQMGSYVFCDCSNLEEVVLPEGLEFMNTGLFENCSSLKKIIIPSTVKQLENSVFCQCKSLEEIVLQEGLEIIGESAFEYCKSLKEIVLPEGLEIIEDCAFNVCSSLTKVTIPQSVKQIGEAAFNWCESLEEVVLPDGLENINKWSFKHCSSLKKVTIPSTVKQIKKSAFKECSSLKEIELPEGLEIINESLFEGCSSLTKVTIPSTIKQIDKNAFKGCSSLQEIALPEGLEIINEGLFEGCSSLTKVTIPSTIKQIDKNAFKGCIRLEEIVLPEGLEALNEGLFGSCISLTKVKIPSTIKQIDKNVFKGCISLEEIVLPEDLEIINEGLFAGCVSLTKVTIPTSVNEIAFNAFDGCSNLKEIVLPEGLEIIDAGLFEGCISLTKVTIPSTVKQIDENAFKGCSSLKEIVLPEGLKIINKSLFKGCSSLTKVTIPSSVNMIAINAFNGCSSLQKIELPEGLRVINGSLFQGCTALKSITIPPNVTSIVVSAFRGCSNLRRVKLQDELDRIDEVAFEGCNSLEEIKLPEGCREIYERAFSNCSKLKKVRLPKNLSVLYENVFQNCPLEELTIYSSQEQGNIVLERIFRSVETKEIHNFTLNIIYDNYYELNSFIKLIKSFIKQSYYAKSKILSINFIGEKLSSSQRFNINRIFWGSNITVSFKSREEFEKEEEVEEDKIKLPANIVYLRDEINTILSKIENDIKDFPNEIKELIKQKMEELLDNYKGKLTVPDIKFDEEKELELGFESPKNLLAVDLSRDLDRLEEKTQNELVAKTIEIIKCLKLIENNVEEYPGNIDTLENTVKSILYLSNKIDSGKKKVIVDEVNNLLTKGHTLFMNKLSKLILDDIRCSTVEYDLMSNNLEREMVNLYSALMSIIRKIGPYLELLKALKCREVKTLAEGNSLIDQIMTLKYSVNIILNDNKKQEVSNLIDTFCDKYINKINEMLQDSDNIKETDYKKLEIEMLNDIQPILEKINFQTHKEMNTKEILEELSRCLSILNSDTVVEVNDESSIESIIGKIHNKVITNQQISDTNKQAVKKKLLQTINKWLDEINRTKEKKEKTDYFRAIIRDINHDSFTIETYLDNLIEAAKYLAIIEGADKATPNSKK